MSLFAITKFLYKTRGISSLRQTDSSDTLAGDESNTKVPGSPPAPVVTETIIHAEPEFTRPPSAPPSIISRKSTDLVRTFEPTASKLPPPVVDDRTHNDAPLSNLDEVFFTPQVEQEEKILSAPVATNEEVASTVTDESESVKDLEVVPQPHAKPAGGDAIKTDGAEIEKYRAELVAVTAQVEAALHQVQRYKSDLHSSSQEKKSLLLQIQTQKDDLSNALTAKQSLKQEVDQHKADIADLTDSTESLREEMAAVTERLNGQIQVLKKELQTALNAVDEKTRLHEQEKKNVEARFMTEKEEFLRAAAEDREEARREVMRLKSCLAVERHSHKEQHREVSEAKADLESQLSSEQSRTTSLLSDVNSHKDQIASLQVHLGNSREETRHLSDKHREQDTKVRQLETNIGLLVSKNESLKEEMLLLGQEKKNTEVKFMGEREDLMRAAAEDREEARREVTRLKSRLAVERHSHQEQHRDLSQAKEVLESQLESERSQIAALLVDITTKNEEIDGLGVHLEASREDSRQLYERHHQQETKIRQLETNLENLLSENGSLKNTTELQAQEKRNLEKLIAEKEKLFRAVTEDGEVAKKEVVQLKSRLAAERHSHKEQHRSVTEANNDLQTQLKSERSRIAALLLDVDAKNNNISSLQSRLESSRKETGHLSKKHREQETKIRQLETDIGRLTLENGSLKDETKVQEEEKKAMEVRFMGEKEEFIRAAVEDREEARREVTRLKSRLAVERHSHKEQHLDLSEAKNNLQTQFESEIINLEAYLEGSREETRRLSEENQQQEAKIRQLEAGLLEERDQASTKDGQIQSLQATKASLESRLHQIQNEINNMNRQNDMVQPASWHYLVWVWVAFVASPLSRIRSFVVPSQQDRQLLAS